MKKAFLVGVLVAGVAHVAGARQVSDTTEVDDLSGNVVRTIVVQSEDDEGVALVARLEDGKITVGVCGTGQGVLGFKIWRPDDFADRRRAIGIRYRANTMAKPKSMDGNVSDSHKAIYFFDLDAGATKEMFSGEKLAIGISRGGTFKFDISDPAWLEVINAAK